MRGEELDAHRILAANARISLEMGISYTGAFDDASASLLGGIALSNNMRMKLYRWDRAEGEALVLLPQWKRGKVSLEIIRRDPLEVEKAVKAAFNGDYKSAMLYNSNYYCRLLGYPIEPVERALEMDVYAGLSGNGPAYVAFGKRENIREVERIWQEYGKLIKTKVVSEAAEDVKIPTYLFVDLDK
jgi:shikimate kinase